MYCGIICIYIHTHIYIVKPYLPYDIIPTPRLTTTFTSPLIPRRPGQGQGQEDGSVNSGVPSTALRVPDWITDCEPLKPVLFSIEADQTLRGLVLPGGGSAVSSNSSSSEDKSNKVKSDLKYCKSITHARQLIVQVLSQDIRGLNQGRGTGIHIPLTVLLGFIEQNSTTNTTNITTDTDTSNTSASANSDRSSDCVNIHEEQIMSYIASQGLNKAHVVYICNLDSMHVEFITTDNTIIVLRISVSKVVGVVMLETESAAAVGAVGVDHAGAEAAEVEQEEAEGKFFF